MLRVYYALLPLDYQRPGGVWWFRDLTAREASEFIEAVRPIATAIRISHQFVAHDPMAIEPPAEAQEA